MVSQDKQDMIKLLKDAFKGIKDKSSIKSNLSIIVSQLVDNIKNNLALLIPIYYTKAVKEVQIKEQVPITLNLADEQAVKDFLLSETLWNSYANTNEIITKNINSIISSNFDGLKFNKDLAREQILKEIPEITNNRVNAILRNEITNIRRIALETSYKKLDPNNEFKYKWIGPKDARTTQICLNIQRRTSKGVSLEELEQIIKEEADPKTYTIDRKLSPHIGCRHTFIRV